MLFLLPPTLAVGGRAPFRQSYPPNPLATINPLLKTLWPRILVLKNPRVAGVISKKNFGANSQPLLGP